MQTLQKECISLKGQLRVQGSDVVWALQRSLDSGSTHRTPKYDLVKPVAESVLARYFEIREHSTSMLCLQAPKASDFRLAVAALKLNEILLSLAKDALSLSRGDVVIDDCEGRVRQISGIADELLKTFLVSISEFNAEKARHVIEMQSDLSELCQSWKSTATAASRIRSISPSVVRDLPTFLRKIKAIAIQASEASNEIIYLATGEHEHLVPAWFTRHQNESEQNHSVSHQK